QFNAQHAGQQVGQQGANTVAHRPQCGQDRLQQGAQQSAAADAAIGVGDTRSPGTIEKAGRCGLDVGRQIVAHAAVVIDQVAEQAVAAVDQQAADQRAEQAIEQAQALAGDG